MKYFIDTEFLEGTQTKRVLGFNARQTKPTIDLISIGIVAEDGREYYAISKEFNLKEAWNRWQKKLVDYGEPYQIKLEIVKEYWLRENVLKPIYEELHRKEMGMYYKMQEANVVPAIPIIGFTYSNLKKLIKKYGKTNAQIAEEVKEFVYNQTPEDKYNGTDRSRPEFYGYYADYDWVVFCWLFGTMMNLPTGFPMYCNDLKQDLANRLKTYTSKELSAATCPSCTHNVYASMDYATPLITMEKCIKDHPRYPKQTNEHNALADARWNKELYKFLKSL